MPTTRRSVTAFVLVFLAIMASLVSAGDVRRLARPGVLGGGITLLPNGWKIAPVGLHLQIGDLPLAMLESQDGHSLLVATNGYARPAVTIVDLRHQYVRDTLVLDHAWLGLAWHPDGTRVYVSGAGNSTVHELRWERDRLTRGTDLVLGRPIQLAPQDSERADPAPQSFVGGLAVSPDGSRLFAVHVLGQRVSAVDLTTGHVVRTIELSAEPYTCLVSPDGSTLFVTLWGGAKVLMFDARTLEPTGEVEVGEHPNAMALTSNGARLFVACANTNSVWAIDVRGRRAVEQISIALVPNAPPGSTPNHVSLSPDEKRLLVSNADNNVVAVVDVSTDGHSEIEGFIPTGWYPTAAMFAHDGRQIFVLSGKGLTSGPNPRFSPRTLPGSEGQYIASLLTGTLSILSTPDRATLQTFTTRAMGLTPYSEAHRLAPAGAPLGSPVPATVGGSSPIKHIFYVIRENRTYDQVFGDLGRGEGDPTLALFGESVTPNAHALAREFGVLDNFYVDAEVSYDGHAFSTAAYATDLIEKFWPTNYARRGAAYLGDGTGEMRNKYGNIAAPMNGYIWDACNRQKITVRSYGEFGHWGPGSTADRIAGKVPVLASVPGLEGRISSMYPAWELAIPDNRRVDLWRGEFDHQVETGTVPALSIVRLGNDHTAGTRPGLPTPRAMVAENDLALGRLVETISHSPVWKDSAIVVLEDDAQNGPDHIDAHRSPVLVISPFSKRHIVESTLYTTSGALRTMELILGLPPMSQYDASATPMYAAFQPTPTLTPYDHLEARVALTEMNEPGAVGAQASLKMDLTEPDRAPDRELNEVLWRAMKGLQTQMPPPVRSAWVRPVRDRDD